MIIYEPIMLAMPLVKRIKEQILQNKKLPSGDDLRKILHALGLEESCLDRGVALYRTKYVFALIIPSNEYIVVDVMSSTGNLSDAIEIMIYHDKTLDSYIIDIVPANELGFEGNIGIEPVIIDGKTFELKSNPVLGHFEKEDREIFLIIEEDTYRRWKESDKIDFCPICGATELAWQGRTAYCDSCGFGIKVVKK